MRPCRDCGVLITFYEKDGKFVPYTKEGEPHRCGLYHKNRDTNLEQWS